MQHLIVYCFPRNVDTVIYFLIYFLSLSFFYSVEEFPKHGGTINILNSNKQHDCIDTFYKLGLPHSFCDENNPKKEKEKQKQKQLSFRDRLKIYLNTHLTVVKIRSSFCLADSILMLCCDVSLFPRHWLPWSARCRGHPGKTKIPFSVQFKSHEWHSLLFTNITITF